jgi:hypothetical protein
MCPLALLLAGSLAAAPSPAAEPPPPDQEYRDASYGAQLNGGVGMGPVGNQAFAEVGGQSYGLRSYEQRWLLQWDGFVGAKGGFLANADPALFWVGGRGGGGGELGHRFQAANAWSFYTGGRLGGNLQVLGHPALPFSALSTINPSDGFGGVAADAVVRAMVGLSYLDSARSLLVVAFIQEAFRAPGVVYPGSAITEGGVRVRFDVARIFSGSLEGHAGVSPVITNQPLAVTNQTLHLEVAAMARMTFANGVFIGVSASVARDSHHVVFLETATTYVSTYAPVLNAALSFGIPVGRQQ